ncbi:MAG: hypothetical protein LBC12_01090 [Nitrososphaerota archaeon]|jgi:hypothetical protein|nr:hypothetical protein [Nitrososphaerota archaeon]
MDKKHVFESIMIAMLLVTMLSTAVFAAYPGPDNNTSSSNGAFGTSVTAKVKGYYTINNPKYTSGTFEVSRTSGTASVYGDLYFGYFIDQLWADGYTPNNSNTVNKGGISANLLSSYIQSYFISGSTVFPLEATAFVRT